MTYLLLPDVKISYEPIKFISIPVPTKYLRGKNIVGNNSSRQTFLSFRLPRCLHRTDNAGTLNLLQEEIFVDEATFSPIFVVFIKKNKNKNE